MLPATRATFACAAPLGSGRRPPGDDDRCQVHDKIMNSLQLVDRRRSLLSETFPLPGNDFREHGVSCCMRLDAVAIDRITRQGDYLQLASVTDMIGLIPAHQHVQANIAKMLIETPLDRARPSHPPGRRRARSCSCRAADNPWH